MHKQNSIHVEHLVKKFGSFTAVNDISLSVLAGSCFAFLGPNGAGKTTTIKILTTLTHPTSGTVHVNGHNPVTQQHEVRKSIGIIFQDPSLDDDLTAYENMEFHGMLYHLPAEQRTKRIKYVLDLVELWERKDSLVKTFSGGMKRRLEIARGLLHEPKILFLDEPTLGLDPQTRNHLWDYIKKLSAQEGMTVFFTTHYMDEAERVADTVAIIDKGLIVTQGTPASIKQRTKTTSLEAAFLKLTGHSVRDESASGMDQLRLQSKMWGRR